MITLILLLLIICIALIYVLFKFGLVLIPLFILIGDLMLFTWIIKKLFFRKKKDKIHK